MSNPFWNEASLEPKRKFRWLLYFDGMPQFVAKSVTKPSFQIGTTAHSFLQHNFNFPGRVTWQDISITIVDPIQPDSAASMYRILKDAGYVTPQLVQSTPDGKGFGTINKADMVKSLGNKIIIEQISGDSSSEVIESWTIFNPQLTSVTFDNLDYSSDELLNITIGIKYDWAQINEEANTGPESWPATIQGGDAT